jgi:hypothetical protein
VQAFVWRRLSSLRIHGTFWPCVPIGKRDYSFVAEKIQTLQEMDFTPLSASRQSVFS